MHELKARPELLTERFQGPPDIGVFGVVVDDLNQQVRVVAARQGSERLAHDLDRLVVGRHLQRDFRLVGRVGPVLEPGVAAQDVDDLQDV